MKPMENELLTMEQVATILGISRQAIYLTRNTRNPMPVVYILPQRPRVRKNDLEAWTERQIKLFANHGVNRPNMEK